VPDAFENTALSECMPVPTLAPEIFSILAHEITRGRAKMRRRSKTDKEFFLQDWFERCLANRFSIQIQGRNSKPDYLVGRENVVEGYELKSLENAHTGSRDPSKVPCRTDVDFNSGIPCGKFLLKRGHRLPSGFQVAVGAELRCHYLFVLYEFIGSSPLNVKGIALTLVDGNYLNSDLTLAEGHKNISEPGFGSYGDGFVRIRKMYRFPNPLTEPDFRYRTVLVTKDGQLEQNHRTLRECGTKSRRTTNGNVLEFHVYTLV